MIEVLSALIGMIATIAAAVVPKILERRSMNATGSRPEPVRFPLAMMFGAFSVAGVWGAVSTFGDSRSSPIPVMFFLAIAGIASALYGFACASRNQHVGEYLGYTSAAIAVGFLLWWPLGSWTSMEGSKLLLNDMATTVPGGVYAILHTAGILRSVQLFGRKLRAD